MAGACTKHQPCYWFQTTWGTEVKIICVAQMSSVDFVYTQHGNWAGYCCDINNPSKEAFYLSNSSGSYFDPVLDA